MSRPNSVIDTCHSIDKFNLHCFVQTNVSELKIGPA